MFPNSESLKPIPFSLLFLGIVSPFELINFLENVGFLVGSTILLPSALNSKPATAAFFLLGIPEIPFLAMIVLFISVPGSNSFLYISNISCFFALASLPSN